MPDNQSEPALNRVISLELLSANCPAETSGVFRAASIAAAISNAMTRDQIWSCWVSAEAPSFLIKGVAQGDNAVQDPRTKKKGANPADSLL
jgi:hypothetical protein